MAKLALPSGIFQINEPILFGLPIIGEPGDVYPHSGSADFGGDMLVLYYLGIIPPDYQYCAVDHANRLGVL